MQHIEDNRLMIAQPTCASVLSVCNDSENLAHSAYGTDAAFVASVFVFFGMELFYRFYNYARFYFYGYYGFRPSRHIPCKRRSVLATIAA